ncbi:MAG: carboxypeptidase-like regulatory domain-containing protein [Flavobacteriales bacterium]
MTKYILLSVFLFLSCSLSSQILIGSVIDEEDNPLIGATILNLNSKKGTVSDGTGRFILETYSGDYIQLSFIGKKTRVKQISVTKQDTIYMIFVLEEDVNKIKEFTVSGKRIKKVAGDFKEYILDYLPLPDDKIVVLKKQKRTYYLSLEEMDTTYYKRKIDFDKPKRFVRDCYGNVHLICKEKAHQLWLTDTIMPLYEVSHKQFDKFLKPLLFCDDYQVITRKFSNHNKLFQIHHVETSSKTPKLLYKTYDKEAEKIAAGWYNQIIAHYYANTPTEQNIIENEVWDGNVISLQVDDRESNRMISWYLKVRARELNIQSFSTEKNVYIFDLQTDSITTLSVLRDTKTKVKTDIDNITSSTKIIHDKSTNRFYYFKENNAIAKLYEINPVTGKSNKVITLNEVKFIKNLKIQGGWLYFLKKKSNGYQKLYRVRLVE